MPALLNKLVYYEQTKYMTIQVNEVQYHEEILDALKDTRNYKKNDTSVPHFKFNSSKTLIIILTGKTRVAHVH